MQLNRKKSYLILVALWAVIFLPALGAEGFRGEEGRRVIPAVNMLKTGNWIVPQIAGRDYHNKPPGINWLIAVSFIITGHISETTARLPSVIFILGFVSLLVWLPGKWLDTSARFIAAIIFMTNITMLEKGRQIEIEAALASMTGMAVFWWLNARQEKWPQWALWLVPAVIIGYGMLVKGPFIAFFFYVTIGAVLFRLKQLKQLLRPGHIFAVIIMAAMNIAWLAATRGKTQTDAMSNMMWHQFIIRFIPENPQRFAETFTDSFVNFLPWLLFVPVLWDKKRLCELELEQIRFFKGARLGLIISFLFIAFLPTGESRYAMPAFATAAVLLGWMMSIKRKQPAGDSMWKFIIFAGLLCSCILAGAGLLRLNTKPFSIFTALLCFAFTAYLIIAERKKDFDSIKLFTLTACLIAILMLEHVAFIVPIRISKELYRPAAKAVTSLVPQQQTIYVFDPGYQTFFFYLPQSTVYIYDPNLIDDKVQYLIVRQVSLDKLGNIDAFAKRNPEIIYEFPGKIQNEFRLIKLDNSRVKW